MFQFDKEGVGQTSALIPCLQSEETPNVSGRTISTACQMHCSVPSVPVDDPPPNLHECSFPVRLRTGGLH
jgi:hypothetical protein